MSDKVLDVQTLTEMILSRISTEKIIFYEGNGSINITPTVEKKQNIDVLFGMFSDGKLSSEEFIKEKQIEKEIEDGIYI